MNSDIKLISHRGNLHGPNPTRENSPSYIDEAIAAGFDVEIDLWATDKGDFLLGHDAGMYHIDFQWLAERGSNLWIHCKNFKALYFLRHTEFNFFFHSEDDFTLTSKCNIWAHPRVSAQEIKGTVYVNQGWRDDTFLKNMIAGKPLGICTDYAFRVRELFEEQK